YARCLVRGAATILAKGARGCKIQSASIESRLAPELRDRMDLLDDLTPAQREAVTHGAGPLLIIAGPGSGKTRVITRRIVYLMQEHGVRANNILAVTFTNKAAGEMRDRVVAALPSGMLVDSRGVMVPPNRLLRIKTFHSFGVELLRFHADRFG